MQKGNLYYVQVDNIPAKALGTAYTVTVSDATQATQTIGYSAYSYVQQVLSGSFEDSLTNVSKALYLYGKAAKDYFPAA